MERSLNNVMNEIARMEKIIHAPKLKTLSTKPLDELSAFIILDETLNELNKQYLSAKAQRKALTATNGINDPMIDIAMDIEDSLWCAMQTRYLELRQERTIMERAQSMMYTHNQQLEDMKERALKHEKDEKTKKLLHYLKIMDFIKQRSKPTRSLEWLEIILFLRMNIITGMSLKRQFNPTPAVA